MSRFVKVLCLAGPAASLLALPAVAQTMINGRWCPPVTTVPEIDASSGLLALAAVGALLAFVAERRRQA